MIRIHQMSQREEPTVRRLLGEYRKAVEAFASQDEVCA